MINYAEQVGKLSVKWMAFLDDPQKGFQEFVDEILKFVATRTYHQQVQVYKVFTQGNGWHGTAWIAAFSEQHAIEIAEGNRELSGGKKYAKLYQSKSAPCSVPLFRPGVIANDQCIY